MRAIVVSCDVNVPLRTIELPAREEDVLAALQAAIDGGLIEMMPYNPPGVVMYGDDEGKLKGLPFNSRATYLCTGDHGRMLPGMDVICGDVVLTGVGACGESAALPEGWEPDLRGWPEQLRP